MTWASDRPSGRRAVRLLLPLLAVAYGSVAACGGSSDGAGSSGSAPPASAAAAVPTLESPAVAGAVPSGGRVQKVVRGSGVPTPTVTASPARVQGTVAYPDGVKLKVVSVTRGVEKGQGPGVFPGRRYVVLGLMLVNGSQSVIDLDRVVVTAMAGQPVAVVSPTYIASANPKDFAGVVRQGASARATYAFVMDPSAKEKVTVVVDFDGAHSSATFSGPLGS